MAIRRDTNGRFQPIDLEDKTISAVRINYVANRKKLGVKFLPRIKRNAFPSSR